MKKLFLGAILGLSLMLASSVASAAFIDFIEGVQETDLITVNTNLILTAPITVTNEYAAVAGFHHPLLSANPVAPGKTFAVLFEPGTQNMVSDYVMLTADPIRQDAAFGVAQDFFIEFFSIDIGFSDLLAQMRESGFAYGGGLVEDGSLQDLSFFLGTLPEGLVVRVQSDVEAIPEPSSIAMFGLGMVALACLLRRKPAALS